MLQVITKKFFREEIPLNSTTHREVIWTNRQLLERDPVALPVGSMAPSTNGERISSVTVEVVEHLEAQELDGKDAVLIATSGREIISDLADVLSFGLNSIFNSNHQLVDRLVPVQGGARNRHTAASVLQTTFEPSSILLEDELDQFRRFMHDLLALERVEYERVIKAIRRIVRAWYRAGEDPTGSYTDIVAALESLSEGIEAPRAPWEKLERRKRELFEPALEGLDPDQVEAIKRAVVDAERLGATSRFVAFALEFVGPEYFRSEAVGLVRPVRGNDLERALKQAYGARSRNAHSLVDLPAEIWIVGNSADTAPVQPFGLMLSLEGLARLSRHVVRAYVDRAEKNDRENFNWRERIPGIVRLEAAPQYWIHNPAGFDNRSAQRYFRSFVESLQQVAAGEEDALVDMRGVLERIEELAPGTADTPAKTSMVGIYYLWHKFIAEEHRRPDADAFLARNADHLDRPSMEAFICRVLTGEEPDWSADEWDVLAENRRSERELERNPSIPEKLDAALQIVVAQGLVDDGRTGRAIEVAKAAVEEHPGSPELIAWEESIIDGDLQPIDLQEFLIGKVE
ncbi:MAG: hypothetical protein HYX29_01495 [Solirubrobacterales bacterium]|nr:hypothetical protein [Solirubrobacterales bacterium]